MYIFFNLWRHHYVTPNHIGKLRNNDNVMIQIITYRSRNENNGFNRRSPSTAEGQHSTWQYITPLNSKWVISYDSSLMSQAVIVSIYIFNGSKLRHESLRNRFLPRKYAFRNIGVSTWPIFISVMLNLSCRIKYLWLFITVKINCHSFSQLGHKPDCNDVISQQIECHYSAILTLYP